MNYGSPAYGAAPAVATKATSVKIIIIFVVITVVGTVIFLGALAIALGVGLGIGLRKSSDSSSSSSLLSSPTVSCNSATATCGCPVNTPTFSSRIIDGTTATSNSWPWMIALYMANGRICSGFLISNRHLLTAANCVYGVSPINITAYVGITTLSNRTNGQAYSVSNVNYPTAYDNSSYLNDIAVLKLSFNVTLGSTVGICCMTSSTSIPLLDDHAVIAGWGETSSTSSTTNTLQQAVVLVRSQARCGISTTSDRQFCADYVSVSTCPTDLGGPLMTSTNNAWTCSGLVSGSSSGCNSAGIYTRVGYYSSFISNWTTY